MDQMVLDRQFVHESTLPGHQAAETRQRHVCVCGNDLDIDDRVRLSILLEHVRQRERYHNTVLFESDLKRHGVGGHSHDAGHDCRSNFLQYACPYVRHDLRQAH